MFSVYVTSIFTHSTIQSIRKFIEDKSCWHQTTSPPVKSRQHASKSWKESKMLRVGDVFLGCWDVGMLMQFSWFCWISFWISFWSDDHRSWSWFFFGEALLGSDLRVAVPPKLGCFGSLSGFPFHVFRLRRKHMFQGFCYGRWRSWWWGAALNIIEHWLVWITWHPAAMLPPKKNWTLFGDARSIGKKSWKRKRGQGWRHGRSFALKMRCFLLKCKARSADQVGLEPQFTWMVPC